MVLALERIVARVENHKVLSKHFVFKGGFVLLKTTNSERFTRDVDALAIGLSRKQIPKLMVEALSQDLQDGLWFGDVKTNDLITKVPYGGCNFNLAFTIGNRPKTHDPKFRKFSRINIDITFDDALKRLPKKQSMMSVLDCTDPVTWSVYPFEFIFAEKLEALFSRGSNNSRAKDIYDMQLIFDKCKNKKLLIQSIQKTFENRKTPIPESFFATANEFELSVIRTAWRSVEISTGKVAFDTAWAAFLETLRSLDS